jgi:hypothetical protein
MTDTVRDGPALGKLFKTPAGQGIRYRIGPIFNGPAIARPMAISAARGMAHTDDLFVLDVVSAVEQPDGAYIVELLVNEQ